MCRGKVLRVLSLIILLGVSNTQTKANSYKWVGGDPTTPTSWNNSNNWQPTGIPGTSDDVQIPATPYNPVVDVNSKINSLIISGSNVYLTLDGTHCLYLVTSLDISSNCHLQTSSSLLKVGSDVKGSGELDLCGKGTLQIGGSLSIGTFTAGISGNSLVVFNGSSQNIVNSYVFDNLQIGSAASTSVVINKDQKIKVTLSGYGTLKCGNYKITLIGDMTLKNFDAGTGSVILEGSCNYQSQVINGYSFYNLSINNNITYLSGTIQILNNLDFETGNISLRSYNFILDSGATITWNGSGTYDPTAGYFISGGPGHFSMVALSTGTLFPVASTNSQFNSILIAPSSSGIYFNVKTINSITDASGNSMSANAVNQSWIISPQSSVSSATVTLQWTDGSSTSVNQELQNFNHNYCYVASRTSVTNPSPWYSTQNSGSASGSDPWTMTSGNVSMSAGSTNYFAIIGGGGSALPVTITDFSATYEDSHVKLNWATASEINNDYFEIERSTDGTTWDEIGKVKGHGNSQTVISYKYTDSPNDVIRDEIIYYRLKQVDFNGLFTYSIIRPVHINAEAVAINAYPNPVHGIINTDWVGKNENSQIRILNLTGTVIYSENINASGNIHRQIDLSEYASGTYILQVFSGTDVTSKMVYKN